MERRNRKPERTRLAGEAEGPQSVRPPGAENYPEPCPREKGTERRCRPDRWIRALWRMTRDGRLLVRHRPDATRPTAGWKGRVATRLAEHLQERSGQAEQHSWECANITDTGE